jgi:hypothetical protein
MRTFLAAWTLAAVVAGGSGLASAAEYLKGHEDLPLLAGLAQDRDSVMVFDTPRGRVVEAVAQTRNPKPGSVPAGAMPRRCRRWLDKKAAGKFVRDGETLVFEVVAKGPPLVLRILLTAD